MSDFMLDLRLVLRSLARRPAFCAVVILTLALGIGANSAIFSVVNGVLLKPLPYRAPEELAVLWSRWSNFDKTWLSEAEYLDYQNQRRLFQDVAAWGDNGEVALTGPEGPESVGAMQMTANLLDVVGMAPAAGRGFTVQEDIPDGPPVAMLGYELWQRRFGGDPSLVGRSILVDGAPATVVGVLPRAFRFPLEFQSAAPAQLIQPLGPNRSAPNRGNHGIHGVARLEPGMTVEQASSELRALTGRWTEEGLYPVEMQFTAFAVPLIEEVSGGVRLALVVLTAAVVLLLLLTCANVANLLLARADGQSREVAVRAALGAGKRQIIRLALMESMVLSIFGGLAGLVLAWAGVRLLVSRAQTTIPRLAEVSVDLRVLLFTLVVAVLTGVLFGLIPASGVARIPLALALRDGARGQSDGKERRRGRTMLIVAEMGLAVLLVITAGLTIRSFRNLQQIDPGFDAEKVLTLRLTLPASQYETSASVTAFYQNLRDQVKRLPGVQEAGFVRLLPLASEIGDAGLAIDGKPIPEGLPGRSADWQTVTPGYFETMRIKLVRGRVFDVSDTPDGVPVIAINETLAREYFPDEDPVGQRIRVGGQTRPWRTVVAVVGDVHHNQITTPVKRAWFVPHNQWTLSYDNPRRSMILVARTAGDPLGLLRPVEETIHRMDQNLTLSQISTLEAVLAGATREQRFTVALMTGFALLALVLAAVGVYGVISYSVSRRTREIGIRLALGADVGKVRSLVLTQGMVPAVAGVAFGLVAAMLLTRYLRAMLYGVAPLDLLTFTIIPLLMLLVAAASVLIPAARASRVQPVEALRSE